MKFNTKLGAGRALGVAVASLTRGNSLTRSGLALTLISAIGGCTVAADDSQGMAGVGAGVMDIAGTAGMGVAVTGIAGTPASGGMGAVATGGMGAGMNGSAGDVASGGMGAGMVATGGMGAGMVATGGMGAGMDGTGGTEIVPPAEDKGEGDGQDVVTIGDSYMRLDPLNGIEVSLEKVSGRDYRNYGVSGTQVLNEQIPGQYTAAIGAGPIKTVIMTGGGNDILIGNILCSVAWTDSCVTTVNNVQARVTEMRDQMATDGVEDIVIVSYGYPTNMSLRPGLDYSMMLIPEACKQTDTPRCHYIDPRVQLEGKIGIDGIHPTAEGYDILGTLVWELLQERGIRR